jgi:hypothetical protein
MHGGLEMEIRDYLSLIAIAISLLSLTITSLATRKTAHREKVKAQYGRSMDYHGELANDLSAFSLYGISVDQLKSSAIPQGQIKYLLRYLIAIGAKIDEEKQSMYDHLTSCTHCRHVLNQKETFETYKIVRLAVGDFIRDGVDRYVEETHKEKLEPAWVDARRPDGKRRSARAIHA